MRNRIAIYAVCAAYVVGAITTFGAAWHRTECPVGTDRFACAADFRAAGAILAAVFWPLTLSVILQEPRP